MSTPHHTLSPSGVWIRQRPMEHCAAEYDPASFRTLVQMQDDHFWYRGRHRFVLEALRRGGGLRGAAIDLGGGCGGWLRYLRRHAPDRFAELALGDSSLDALSLARAVVPPDTAVYQVDLMDLEWRARWDVAFLLDVIEHLPDDAGALSNVRAALTPGGLAVVTVPAFPRLWSWNDDAARHQRRYTIATLSDTARRAGFRVADARYFMFFLSPLLVLSRLGGPGRDATESEIQARMERSHAVPAWPVNEALAAVFGAETPLGHAVRFPWGTSLLAVLAAD